MQKHREQNAWLTNPAPCASQLSRQWLTRQGALTNGLRQLGELQLRVISEQVCRATPPEAHRLGLHSGHALWQREVCMSIDGVACVVAHSVAPLNAAHGHWQALKRLHSRPLADILYGDRAIVRSAFEFSTLRLGMPLYALAQEDSVAGARVLARRSVFVRANQPLLVAEAFLPSFWTIARRAALQA